MKKARDLQIDYYKGIAIIIVVLGHSIQFWLNEYGDNIIYRIIYSFHMPFFMFLSGLIYHNEENICLNIGKKTKRLFVPFVMWYLLTGLLEYKSITQTGIVNYIIQMFVHPDTGLWFLYILWLNSLVLIFVKLVKDGNYLLLKFSVILLIVCLGNKLFFYTFPFYWLGTYFREAKFHLIIVKKKLLVCLIFVFAVIIPFWHTNNPYCMEHLFALNISAPIINVIKYFYYFTVALLGIIIMSNLFYGTYKIRYIATLGIFSFDIYVVHQIMFKYIPKLYLLSLISDVYTIIIATTVFLIIFSLSVSFYILRKNNHLKYLFLGI